MTDNLISLRNQLAEIRVVLERYNFSASEIWLKVKHDYENDNAELLHTRESLAEEESHLEAEIRKAIIDHYCATGEKKPIPGFGVRVTKSLTYDKSAALKWALEHGGVAVTLDAKAFEKVVQALPEIPNFVLVEEKVIATISPDLGEFLPKAEAAA